MLSQPCVLLAIYCINFGSVRLFITQKDLVLLVGSRLEVKNTGAWSCNIQILKKISPHEFFGLEWGSGVVDELCLKFWQISVRRTLIHDFTSNGVYNSVIVECI